jgi:hypothetical protein
MGVNYEMSEFREAMVSAFGPLEAGSQPVSEFVRRNWGQGNIPHIFLRLSSGYFL